MSVDAGTDFWRETGYGYIRDNGHVYGEVLAGDLDVSVRLRGVLESQFDQAGVMLRADEQTWLKTGIEFFEGRPRLSTVLTLGRSSWMVTDLPDGADDILLRVSRRGDAVEVRYLVGDGEPELAALMYMPPGAEVLAGVMAAAPEGSGFRVTFHDLHIAERDWSADAAEAGDWADEAEPAWESQEPAPAWDGPEPAPAWEAQEPTPAWEGQEAASVWESSRPESERPSWASGAASEDHPSWPTADPGGDRLSWPAPEPAADHPSWPGAEPAADHPSLPGADPADDHPSWPGAEPAGDHPSWPGADPADDHPSWPAVDPADDIPGGDDPDWVKKLADTAEPDWATDATNGHGPGWGTTPPAEDEPTDAPVPTGVPAPAEAPATAGQTPDEPGDKPGDEPDDKPGREPAKPTDSSWSAWSAAPTLGPLDLTRPTGWVRSADLAGPADPDAKADWDRLAAGTQMSPAERWTAQTDADVANEWPGPPLRAARRAAISNGLTTDEPAEAPPAPAAPGPAASAEEPDAPPESEPPDDQTDPGLGPAESREPAHAKRRGASPGPAAPRSAGLDPAAPPKAAAARPPLDLPGPPDPADEWISLLTADPAEE